MKLKVKLLNDFTKVPEYATKGSAAFDLSSSEDVVLYVGNTKLIPTGLAFEIPEGFELQIRPRSGMSYKTGFRIANSPGTIDSDYRGEVSIIAETNGEAIVHIKKGDRIAQAVLAPVTQAEFEVINDLTETERGEGGFGSTGV